MKLAVLALFAVVACTPARPISSFSSLPKESAKECADHCALLDMKLASVVIVANSVGCVCDPKDGAQHASGGAAAAAGAILVKQQEEAAASGAAAGASAGTFHH